MAESDRILLITRVLAALVVPFLVTAFVILYLMPQRSGELFAWPIAPEMTAMMLGASYFGGAYYFTRVVFEKRWHRVKLALPGVTAFVWYMGIATLLHWDRFTPNHISFFFWALLYFVLPFVLIVVYLLNRRQDPGTPEPDDVLLPRGLRLVFGGIGVVVTLVSVLLFVAPDLMIPIWPWRMTPLTARVIAAMFVLTGLIGLGIALDGRWSAARLILQAQMISLALIVVAALASWSNFDATQLTPWLFVGGMAGLFVFLLIITVWAERRHRQNRSALTGSTGAAFAT